MFILASASKARSSLLKNARLDFDIYPADIDESIIKNKCKSENKPSKEAALELAIDKAKLISNRYQERLVVGADQMMSCEGRWFDKPENKEMAREHLSFLRGKTHLLSSAAVVVKDGEVVWRHIDQARLTMRDFSDDFLNDYLEEMADDTLQTVGSYRLEKRGIQLFDKIDGDYFTILGFPLLDFMGFLREQNIVRT